MKENKIIKVLDAAKNSNGLNFNEIKHTCGIDTDFVIAYLNYKDICIWGLNNHIINVKEDKADYIIKELIEERRERRLNNLKWIITTTISLVALFLSIFN